MIENDLLRHTGLLTGEELNVYRIIIQIDKFDFEITNLENSKIGLKIELVPNHVCNDGIYRVPEKYKDHHKLVKIDSEIRKILKERDKLFKLLRVKTDQELREERLNKILDSKK